MTIDRRLREDLRRILGADGVVDHPADLRTYECDANTGYREAPGLVVLPRTTAEVASVLRACAAAGVPIVPRGAGTGLSGGALPHPDGVLVVLVRLREIREVDPVNRLIRVQAGVTTAEADQAAGRFGLYLGFDPGSATVCTIGGNVAENAGGAHCLKYGFTSHHVLALEVVLPDGEVAHLGGAAPDSPGYDLRGVMVGSEGTMGIVTEATLRLLPRPEAVATFVAEFPSAAAAGAAVSGIIGAGIIPACMEMIDHLAIQAGEDEVSAGFSRRAGAILLVELDGVAGEVDADLPMARRVCEQAGATGVRTAGDAAERALIWAGRTAASAAVGRLSPDYLGLDCVVPRGRLAEALAVIGRLSQEAGIRVANVLHAGDGNLHPLILYDASDEEGTARAGRLAMQIVEQCVAYGGSITGEHGVGVEKAGSMPRMFSAEDLELMARVRAAFDPAGRCNPGKVLPTPGSCAASAFRAAALEERR